MVILIADNIQYKRNFRLLWFPYRTVQQEIPLTETARTVQSSPKAKAKMALHAPSNTNLFLGTR